MPDDEILAVVQVAAEFNVTAHSLVETGVLGSVPSAPGGMDYKASFDTGLISPADQVTGTRAYGLGTSDSFFFTHPQGRAAFCAILSWAKTAQPGYSLLPPQPSDPDHC